MPTTWTISIDWDRNGNYTGTYDDVINRVMQINWFLGMRKAYQEVADNSLLTLVLENIDKRYSPENASGPLFGKVVPQRPIRIESYDGTETRTHWVGWVEAIQPAVNKNGERVTKILASGAAQFYKAAETKIKLQENKRSDEIIAELIKEVVIPPALNRAWILGYVGNSELSVSSHLADTTAYSSLEAGKLTLGMAADNWVREGGLSNAPKDTFDVLQSISDITAAEHGKFFFDREGKAVFWNRHHLLNDDTSSASFNDTMTEMAYTYSGIEQIQNEVIVVCHPRKISPTATDVLWELGDSFIQLSPGETKTFYVKYKDQGKARVGGKELIVSDLVFEEGTATVTVDEKANGADLKLVNNSAITGAVITSLKLKGRKIVDSGDMEAKAQDNSSIVNYGRRTLRINLPSIDKLENAQAIADYERDRRGQAHGEINSITMLSHGRKGGGQHTHQIERKMGDLITVSETQTAHSKKYYIIGEAHELTAGATLWKTTWYLEPSPEPYPWRLGDVGRSELGASTRLTY